MSGTLTLRPGVLPRTVETLSNDEIWELVRARTPSVTSVARTKAGGLRPKCRPRECAQQPWGAAAAPLTDRSDIHTVREYARVSASLAIAIAGNQDQAAAAATRLVDDWYRKGTRSVRNSRAKLWEAVANAAGFENPYDLTPVLVNTVIGVLR